MPVPGGDVDPGADISRQGRYQHGKAAGVLLSPVEYDNLVYEKRFLASMKKGLNDIEEGCVYDSEEAMAELEKRLKAQGF